MRTLKYSIHGSHGNGNRQDRLHQDTTHLITTNPNLLLVGLWEATAPEGIPVPTAPLKMENSCAGLLCLGDDGLKLCILLQAEFNKLCHDLDLLRSGPLGLIQNTVVLCHALLGAGALGHFGGLLANVTRNSETIDQRSRGFRVAAEEMSVLLGLIGVLNRGIGLASIDDLTWKEVGQTLPYVIRTLGEILNPFIRGGASLGSLFLFLLKLSKRCILHWTCESSTLGGGGSGTSIEREVNHYLAYFAFGRHFVSSVTHNKT